VTLGYRKWKKYVSNIFILSERLFRC